MMEIVPPQLIHDAASLYLQITEISVDYGLIGVNEWHERLAFLVKHGGRRFKDLRDYVHPHYLEDDERDDQSEWSVETKPDSENPKQDIEAEDVRGIHIPPPEPIICRFVLSLPSSRQATHRWRFHATAKAFLTSLTRVLTDTARICAEEWRGRKGICPWRER
jgi:hypothetical protein